MTPPPDILQAKQDLRRLMRERLSGLGPEAVAIGSRRIVEALLAPDSRLAPTGAVALFGGLKGEPDLLTLLEWLRRQGRDAVFFSVQGSAGLVPFAVPDADSLIRGPFGVLMPDEARCRRVELETIGTILVPGLAFSTQNGARLGRGKGYYDRVLARAATGTRIIGVGLDLQMIASVPQEPHDCCLPWLLSEAGWREIPPGRR